MIAFFSKAPAHNIRLARFLVDLFVYGLIITVVGVERRTRGTRFRQLNCSPSTCINMYTLSCTSITHIIPVYVSLLIKTFEVDFPYLLTS